MGTVGDALCAIGAGGAGGCVLCAALYAGGGERRVACANIGDGSDALGAVGARSHAPCVGGRERC